jgi:uncharacterized membrane protein
MIENHDDESENGDEGVTVSNRLLMLLTIGFVLILVGVAVMLVATVLGGASASFGGVIFIGPFPIVIGAGPDAVWLVSIGIILAVLSVIVFMITRRRIESSGD